MKRLLMIATAAAAITFLMGWLFLSSPPALSPRGAPSHEGEPLSAAPRRPAPPSAAAQEQEATEAPGVGMGDRHRAERSSSPSRRAGGASAPPTRAGASPVEPPAQDERSAGSAVDSARQDAPLDTIDRRIDVVRLRLVPSRVSYATDQALRVDIEVEGSPDVVEMLAKADLAITDPGFTGVSHSVACTDVVGPGRLSGTIAPRRRGLVQGTYALRSLSLLLRGGERLAVPASLIDAEDPLLVITAEGPPLRLLWARVDPVEAQGGEPVFLEFEVGGSGRAHRGTAAYKYGPEGRAPGPAVAQVALPKGRIRLQPLARPDQSTAYRVTQLMVMTPDGRRGIWSGDPLTFTVGPAPADEPMTVRSIDFEPPIAEPGETVDLVVGVSGGEADNLPSDMTIAGIARLIVSRDRTAEVRLLRRVGQDHFRGRFKVEESLTPGVITVDRLDLPTFGTATVEVDREHQAALFTNAHLTVN